MGVFSKSNLLSSVNESTLSLDTYSLVEECYFAEAMRYAEENRREYNQCVKKLYVTIFEAGNSETVVNESFSDFFKSVGDLIDKFLKFIKSLFERFMTALMNLFKNDKHILNHKKEFENFNERCEFDIKGFEYTFSDDIPVMSALAEYKDDFFSLSDPSTDANSSVKAFQAKLRDNWYDRFRSRVLGRPETQCISSGYFAEELFAEFRNAQTDESLITVDKMAVDKALDSFISFEKTKTATQKTHKAIESEYIAIKKYVNSAVKVTGTLNGYADIVISDTDASTSSHTVSSADSKDLNLFIKAKVDQLTEMQNIHALAFGAKLDAIKEEYAQNRKLLFIALGKVQKRMAYKEASYIEESAKTKQMEREFKEVYDTIVDSLKDIDLDVQIEQFRSPDVSGRVQITNFDLLVLAPEYMTDPSDESEFEDFVTDVYSNLDTLSDINTKTKFVKVVIDKDGYVINISLVGQLS